MTTHDMFDGRLQVYRRGGEGRFWQCAARVGGVRFRSTTKEESLERAKDFAEEWYLELRGKMRRGEIALDEKTFGEAADQWIKEATVLAATSRSPLYVPHAEQKLKRYMRPFMASKPLSKVNLGLIQEYRVWRHDRSMERFGKPVARSTMRSELVYVRQILKTAVAHGWLPFVPNLSPPYMTQGKKGHRAWFSPNEYKALYTATRERIAACPRPGWKSHYEDMHDYVLLMVNSGLRPDEAKRLEIRDGAIEKDAGSGQTIVVFSVRGKTGTGYCKTMPGAVQPFKRVLERRQAEALAKGVEVLPTDRLLRPFDRDLFNTILTELNLKFDREGNRRTAYSLRHTYISMRLMEGANIYMVANNCRTSVKMIEEHYAVHIKDYIDASAVNVKRKRAKPEKSEGSQAPGI